MTEPTKLNTQDAYINNPFFIGAKGINLLFLKAQSVAILLVVLSVIMLVLGNIPGPDSATTENAAPAVSDATVSVETAIGIGVGVLVGIFVALTVGTFLTGIMSYTAAKAARGESSTIKEGLSATYRRFWSFLWLQILTTLKVLAWSLLFIVPGFIKAVRYSVANVAFFDKDLKGNAAIQHSIALTKGSWITTLGGLFFFNLITLRVLELLTTTASTAVLYRQFEATPNNERPGPHGLSIAMLVLTVLLGIVLVVGLFYLIASGANYIQGAPADVSNL
jgi:uncharacterized membrane protein